MFQTRWASLINPVLGWYNNGKGPVIPLAYTATPSEWVSPAPTTVQEALDRLAALAVTLNSGNPIP